MLNQNTLNKMSEEYKEGYHIGYGKSKFDANKYNPSTSTHYDYTQGFLEGSNDRYYDDINARFNNNK